MADNIVSLSTTENEYVATTRATKEVFRLQSLFCKLFNPLGGFAIAEGQTLRRRTRTPRGFKEGECWKLDEPSAEARYKSYPLILHVSMSKTAPT